MRVKIADTREMQLITRPRRLGKTLNMSLAERIRKYGLHFMERSA